VTTIELCQIKFVDRESFLRLLNENSQAALACARLLSEEIAPPFTMCTICCWRVVRPKKLARLLLSWAAKELTTRRSAWPQISRMKKLHNDRIVARNGNPLAQ